MPRAFHLLMIAIAGISLASSLSADDKAPPEKRKPWTTSRLHGSPEPPEPYKLVSAFPAMKFERPTCIEDVTGQNRLLITQMNGKVFTFAKDPKVSKPDLVIDLAANLPKDLAGKNVSLWDAELHPKFTKNRQFFVCYVHPGNGGHTRVSRLTLSKNSPQTADPKSEEVILTWPSG